MLRPLRGRWDRYPTLATAEAVLTVLLLLLALGGFVRVLPTLLRGPEQRDFLKYYAAAHALNAGQPLYSALVPAAGSEETTYNYVGAPLKYNYLYPPVLATLLRPLAALSVGAAKSVWYCLNLLFLVTAVALTASIVGVVHPRSVGILTGLALLLPAVYDTLTLGQVNLLVLLLIVAAVWLGERQPQHIGWEMLVGSLLGLAVVIKVYPLLLGAVLLSQRRLAALLALGISVILFSLGGVVAGGGWHNSQVYLQEVLPNTGQSLITSPQNQNVQAVVYRLFAPNQFRFAALSATNIVTVTSRPIIDAPQFGLVLGYVAVVAIMLLTGSVIVCNRRRSLERSAELGDWAVVIAALLLITPITWDHYYVLLMLPVAILWYDRRSRAPLLPLALLGAGLLIMLHRYWHWIALHTSSPLFLMFGWLGVLVIWLTALRARSREQPIPALPH